MSMSDITIDQVRSSVEAWIEDTHASQDYAPSEVEPCLEYWLTEILDDVVEDWDDARREEYREEWAAMFIADFKSEVSRQADSGEAIEQVAQESIWCSTNLELYQDNSEDIEDALHEYSSLADYSTIQQAIDAGVNFWANRLASAAVYHAQEQLVDLEDFAA